MEVEDIEGTTPPLPTSKEVENIMNNLKKGIEDSIQSSLPEADIDYSGVDYAKIFSMFDDGKSPIEVVKQGICDPDKTKLLWDKYTELKKIDIEEFKQGAETAKSIKAEIEESKIKLIVLRDNIAESESIYKECERRLSDYQKDFMNYELLKADYERKQTEIEEWKRDKEAIRDLKEEIEELKKEKEDLSNNITFMRVQHKDIKKALKGDTETALLTALKASKQFGIEFIADMMFTALDDREINGLIVEIMKSALSLSFLKMEEKPTTTIIAEPKSQTF